MKLNNFILLLSTLSFTNLTVCTEFSRQTNEILNAFKLDTLNSSLDTLNSSNKDIRLIEYFFDFSNTRSACTPQEVNALFDQQDIKFWINDWLASRNENENVMYTNKNGNSSNFYKLLFENLPEEQATTITLTYYIVSSKQIIEYFNQITVPKQ